MQAPRYLPTVLLLACFLIPFFHYFLTCTDSLMFDDAAEFALVIKLGSIAHSPGTPAYILGGMIWNSLSSVFSSSLITRLNLFSVFLVSTAIALLYLALRNFLLLSRQESNASVRLELSAAFAALAFGLGPVTWSWANTIEVYGFQVFAMALLLFGLTSWKRSGRFPYLLLASIGWALGLSNHHLTMIVFSPFIPFFFLSDFFYVAAIESKSTKKKKSAAEAGTFSKLLAAIRTRDFFRFTLIAAVFTLTCYAWMFWRAQSDYAFMFGQPKDLGALFFHVRGGAYTKNITDTSSGMMAVRFPYFLNLTAQQLGIFLIPFFWGVYEMFRSRRRLTALVVLCFYALLFIYQVRNNQWASTDAYMLLPFLILSIPVAEGIFALTAKPWARILVPIALVLNFSLPGYAAHNRKTYPVSRDLMELLDASAPRNSVVIISDWTTVIQYYYYRIAENFRPDLTVLNYDIKFTHFRILPILYPAFYTKIQPEYDGFIEALRSEHPYQVVNTGCDLNTPYLLAKFKTLVAKMEKVCSEENRPFLIDPKGFVFYTQQGLISPQRHVSGCFVSSMPPDSISAAKFLPMDFTFLESPLLRHDPSCLDKLVDFQAMLDQHITYYSGVGDTLRARQAERSREKILKLQRELKQSMSFAYKK